MGRLTTLMTRFRNSVRELPHDAQVVVLLAIAVACICMFGVYSVWENACGN